VSNCNRAAVVAIEGLMVSITRGPEAPCAFCKAAHPRSGMLAGVSASNRSPSPFGCARPRREEVSGDL